jgi:hypothetical protein
MSGCKASEILRNAAYREVRRSASGPEGRGMRVTQPFDFAQGRELVERQMGVFRQPLIQNRIAQRLHETDHPGAC